MNFTKLLVAWYLQNARDLPWRRTQSPYHIWLSEIILQQTRVAQGLPYYHSFVEAFPSVQDLASADEQSVLKLWQGLGYYSRARNLHKAAKQVMAQYSGNFPDSYIELLKLKGVGQYTAAAIASFAFNECAAVVDGNVYRVLARFFGIPTDVAGSRAYKEFHDLASTLIKDADPALFNQAIMEFGALQCVPKSPDCTVCPLAWGCVALRDGVVNSLPVKSKKAALKKRFFNYIVAADRAGKYLVKQRTGKGIWQNLYEFPMIESSTLLDEASFSETLTKSEIFGANYVIKPLSHYNIEHKLTHQHLFISFHQVEVDITFDDGQSKDEIAELPMPVPIANFIVRHWG